MMKDDMFPFFLSFFAQENGSVDVADNKIYAFCDNVQYNTVLSELHCERLQRTNFSGQNKSVKICCLFLA